MAAAKYGKGFMGLLKQGWNEIPEILGSSVVGLIGVAFMMYGVHLQSEKHHIKTYRAVYTVYRDDDPRVEELRKIKALN
ncbi:hypothetical protein CHUAL_011905 [Chamberlinius hualienensis]